MAETTFFSMNSILQGFEYDAVNYIYDMPPRQNNMFWAGNLSSSISSNALQVAQGAETHTLADTSFRIQSVNFNLPSLNFEKNEITKIDKFDKVEIPTEVTITYLEDVYTTVQMYHQEWFSCWYNRDLDCMVSGTTGKFRSLDLVRFHFVNSPSTGQEDLFVFGLPGEVPTPEVVYHYKLLGLVPKTFEPVNFSYSDDGNEGTVSYTYSVARILATPNTSLPTLVWNPTIGDLNPQKENITNILENELPGAIL